MTTDAAARQYAAEHCMRWGKKPLVIFNPHHKPVEDLPFIYGFNNGGRFGMLSALLVAEDGTHLGSHCCSDECYMPFDLGCVEGARPDRHEYFQEYYPDGYRMSFVGYAEVDSHLGLACAIAKSKSMQQELQMIEPKFNTRTADDLLDLLGS